MLMLNQVRLSLDTMQGSLGQLLLSMMLLVFKSNYSRSRDMTLLVALKDVDLKDVHWFAESK